MYLINALCHYDHSWFYSHMSERKRKKVIVVRCHFCLLCTHSCMCINIINLIMHAAHLYMYISTCMVVPTYLCHLFSFVQLEPVGSTIVVLRKTSLQVSSLHYRQLW